MTQVFDFLIIGVINLNFFSVSVVKVINGVGFRAVAQDLVLIVDVV